MSVQNRCKIYCIPGLGVDSRIFGNLKLDADVSYLEWIEPLPDESLLAYTQRMAEGISDERDCILLGLSFGGIVAQQMARLIQPQKLILISCIKQKSEKPLIFRIFEHIPLYQLSKGNWRIKSMPYWAPRFGIKNRSDILLLQDMFSGFSDNYRMWALKQLACWQGDLPEFPTLHLHGDCDSVFPISRIKNAVEIKGGNHYMIKQRADEISQIINDWI